MKNLLASLLSKRIFCIKNLSEKMVKLQMAAGYVKTIKVFRKIQMSLFAMLFCMIFFISGITIIHITILFFAPWTEITRIILTVIFGCIYIFLGVGLFIFLISEKNIIQLFRVDELIEHLTKDDQSDQKRRV